MDTNVIAVLLSKNGCEILQLNKVITLYFYEHVYYGNLMFDTLTYKMEVFNRLEGHEEHIHQFSKDANLEEELAKGLQLVKQWYLDHPDHPLGKIGMMD